jgi:hypothetical protein
MYNLDNYGFFLRGLQDAGYEFCFFDEIKKILPRESRCLLRHDVDVDVGAAFQLAKVEMSLGVHSTFFLMLRSPVYNLMARHNHQAVLEILAMGHNIGLHYDAGFFIDNKPSHELNINQQAEWLEKEFDVKVHAVSFHQPGLDVLNGLVKTGLRVNTYDKVRLANFAYFSDSNRTLKLSAGSWQPSIDPINISDLHKQNIQLLIHPMWWVYDSSSVENVWNRAIANNFEMFQQQMIATERAYGQKRSIFFIKANE